MDFYLKTTHDTCSVVDATDLYKKYYKFKCRCKTYKLTDKMLMHPSREWLKNIIKWLKDNNIDYKCIKIEMFKQDWQVDIYPISPTIFFKFTIDDEDAMLFKLVWG